MKNYKFLNLKEGESSKIMFLDTPTDFIPRYHFDKNQFTPHEERKCPLCDAGIPVKIKKGAISIEKEIVWYMSERSHGSIGYEEFVIKRVIT